MEGEDNMSVVGTIVGIHSWMMENKVHIIDFNIENQIVYAAIVGNGKSQEEIDYLARELKTLVIMARMGTGKGNIPLRVRYKTIDINQEDEAIKNCADSVKRLRQELNGGVNNGK